MEIPYLNEAVIGTVCAGLGVVVAKGIDIFRAKKGEDREDKKNDAAIEKGETAQALDAYRSLLDGLRTDMKEMLGHLHQLEKDHLACREENAALRVEVKVLRDENASLLSQVKVLTDRVKVLETKV